MLLLWMIANGLSTLLLSIVLKLGNTNYAAFNKAMGWEQGTEFLFPVLIPLVISAGVLLPGLVLRQITRKVPLFIYVAGILCYGIAAVLLTYLLGHIVPRSFMLGEIGSWRVAEFSLWQLLVYQRDTWAWGLAKCAMAVSAAILLGLISYLPMILMIKLRDGTWRFPLLFLSAMMAGQVASGIVGILYSAHYFHLNQPLNFDAGGFELLGISDVQMLGYFFIPSAIGAIASFWILCLDENVRVSSPAAA
jgi:hypothetical protein